MPATTFQSFMREVEREAKAEGPKAWLEMVRLRNQFRSRYFDKCLRQIETDRTALIDLICCGMVQKLDNYKEPRLSKEARDAVKRLERERRKALDGVAKKVPKSKRRSRRKP
jgi:hypothetical protein